MGALLVKRVGCKTFHRILYMHPPEKSNENGGVSDLVQSEL